nr:DUF1501 domain-containing protein [Thaumasiovibrio subtropicus]
MKLTRRHFLKGSAAVSGTTLMPLSLTLPGTAHAAGNDYKALICLFLYGGNDSFNMVVPADAANHTNYLAARPDIGLQLNEMADMAGFTDEAGQQVRLNGQMPNLAQLMLEGAATTIVNVGTMLEPTTKANYSQVRKPANLGAHNKQQLAWQRSWNISEYNPFGWAGMMMDILASPSLIAENMEISGGELLDGQQAIPVEVESNGVAAMDALGHSNIVKENFSSLVDNPYGSLFSQAYTARLQGVRDFQEQLDAVFAANPEDESINPSYLGRQLRMVKRLMQSSEALGHQRQVFFVSTGGFDNHRNQRGRHDGLLADIDQVVTQFYRALEAEGLSDKAVLFSMSDFGRTIENNSNAGTDHGWGSNQIVVGGAVQGGKAYGRYPSFVRDGVDAIGNKFIPSTSSEQMAATLCQWFGLSESSIDYIFPSLRPTNTNAFSSRYLGFLGNVTTPPPVVDPAVLVPAAVVASVENANGTGAAINAIDGNPETRWSAKGIGVTYTLTLSSPATISLLRYKQVKGDVRSYMFDIQTSTDGVTFTTIASVTTPGNSADWLEAPLTGDDITAVRLVCNGNNDPVDTSLRGWNNFIELEVWGV